MTSTQGKIGGENMQQLGEHLTLLILHLIIFFVLLY
jgi:hypothetical protein